MEANPDRTVVHDFGPDGDEPGIALHPFILTDQAESAVALILPYGLVETVRHFVDDAVHAVGGTGVAIADQRLARGVVRRVAADVYAAVAGVQQRISDNRFDTIHSARGMDWAQRAAAALLKT